MGSSDLVAGLGTINDSGYSGIATLHDDGDGSAAVTIHLMLTQWCKSFALLFDRDSGTATAVPLLRVPSGRSHYHLHRATLRAKTSSSEISSCRLRLFAIEPPRLETAWLRSRICRGAHAHPRGVISSPRWRWRR